MKTAVEQFWDKIALKLSVEQVLEFMPLLEQAKEIEKEQIVNAVDGFPLPNRGLNGDEYYEQTYGGN